MVRPERFELPTFWFVAARTILPNLARGVANRAHSASWDNFAQTAFSFFYCHLLHNCRCLPPFALHFRDSAVRAVLTPDVLVRVRESRCHRLACSVPAGWTSNCYHESDQAQPSRPAISSILLATTSHPPALAVLRCGP
jgi:hypothetical protein